MLFSRRFLTAALCCGAIAVSVGACEEGKPASADEKFTVSTADPPATTSTPAQKAHDSSRPSRKRKTRSREQSGSTATNRSDTGAGRAQTSSDMTAAERRAFAKAQRLGRSGTVTTDAPSTEPRQARPREARDDWELYQQREGKNRAK